MVYGNKEKRKKISIVLDFCLLSQQRIFFIIFTIFLDFLHKSDKTKKFEIK